MKAKRIIVEIICLLFVALWVYAGFSKWTDPEFTDQLSKSPYLEGWSGIVSVALPVGELLMAILLIFPATKLLGLYLSFFTMVLFTGYIYAMINYSHYTPCSCGGILSKMDWNTHFIFNLGFCVLAIVGILLWKKPTLNKQSLILQNSEI